MFSNPVTEKTGSGNVRPRFMRDMANNWWHSPEKEITYSEKK
jgi:hypothetical protein